MKSSHFGAVLAIVIIQHASAADMCTVKDLLPCRVWMATMPELSSTPSPITPQACRSWAAQQSEDALDMWGIQEDGTSSRSSAIDRLTLSCLGADMPEIVGSRSSAGAAEEYCLKHRGEKVCQTENDADVSKQGALLTMEKRADKKEGMLTKRLMGNNIVLERNFYNAFYLVITSHADNIEIKDVIINRGNCSFVSPADFPIKLKFGQDLEAQTTCNFIEVKIDTDQGSVENTWER